MACETWTDQDEYMLHTCLATYSLPSILLAASPKMEIRLQWEVASSGAFPALVLSKPTLPFLLLMVVKGPGHGLSSPERPIQTTGFVAGSTRSNPLN